MIFTDEQFNALSRWESYFVTATKENWSRYPGMSAIDFMLSLYNEVFNQHMRINKSCQTCILNLLKDLGVPYFKDKTERENKPKKARKK